MTSSWIIQLDPKSNVKCSYKRKTGDLRQTEGGRPRHTEQVMRRYWQRLEGVPP